MDDDIKKLAEDACGGDEDCIKYLYEKCPELYNKYPSQMDYYLTGRDCLVEYAKAFKAKKEQ